MSSMTKILGGLLLGGALAAPTWATSEAQQRLITQGEVTIAYSVRGAGPLILLLASTGRASAELTPVADRLAARGYRVALPEPRGIGGSIGPLHEVSFHDFAADFQRVVRAEGGPAIIAGHAYGQWIAKTLAADYPADVRGIVLLAGGARQWPRALSDAVTALNDPASSRDTRLAALRLAFFAPGNDPTPWVGGWHPEVMNSQRQARERTPRASYWSGGTAPILDLQAEADPFRPAASRRETQAEFGERVTVTVIPGASHALPAEKPWETADAIADWAATLPHP